MKQAAQIVSRSSRLSQLTQRAQQLSQLQELVLSELAPALREQVLLGDYQQGALTLLVRDAVWLTRLRYQQASLLKNLSKHPQLAGLRSIRFKISLPVTAPQPAPKPPLEIGAGAREHIAQLADSLNESDSELSAALRRLLRD